MVGVIFVVIVIFGFFKGIVDNVDFFCVCVIGFKNFGNWKFINFMWYLFYGVICDFFLRYLFVGEVGIFIFEKLVCKWIFCVRILKLVDLWNLC